MHEPHPSQTDAEPDAVTRLLARRKGKETTQAHQFPRSAVNYDYDFIDDDRPQPEPLKHSVVRWQSPSLKSMGVLLAVFIVVIGLSYFLSQKSGEPAAVVSTDAESSVAEAKEEPRADASPALGAGVASSANASLIVHVTGQVHRPGVIELPHGSRVNDAVEKAGGVTAEADTSKVNLAAPATDGAQVYIPAVGEEIVGQPTVGNGSVTQPSATGGPGIINLNTASSEQLQELPKVGPATAEKIIAWREANGGFSSVTDLDNVPGIGPAMLETLTPLVTV